MPAHLPENQAPQPPRWKIALLLLAVQMTFAGYHVSGKLIFRHLSPLDLAGLRVGFATPLLLILAWHKDHTLPRLRDLPVLALLGLLGVCLNQVLFAFGLYRTTATSASILMLAIPVFAVAIGAISGIEHIGWRRQIGIASALFGAVVMLHPTASSMSESAASGNLLIVLNSLCYAGFLVFQRPILRRLPWLTVIAWSFLFGSIGVESLAARDLSHLTSSQFPPEVIALLVYVILLPTVFAYSTNTWGVHRATPIVVAAFVTLQPAATSLLAHFVLGETLNWQDVLGFTLILAGLIRVSLSSGKRKLAT